MPLSYQQAGLVLKRPGTGWRLPQPSRGRWPASSSPPPPRLERDRQVKKNGESACNALSLWETAP